jgi:hypothetical protein
VHVERGDHGIKRFSARSEAAMTWVFLEIAVALAIAVAIVWWTFPRKPRERDQREEPPPGNDS